MITRLEVVRVAREWAGTRYQHQAMLKGVATDCIGLIAGVAYELGIADARPQNRDPAFNGYGRSPDPRLLQRACEQYLDAIDLEDAGCGDILTMAMPPETEPKHFAIISAVDPMYVIHAYAQARKVVENRVDEHWVRRIIAAWRFRGVAF